MQSSAQHQNREDNAQELVGSRGKYRALFVVKGGLGILLLVLGGLAHKNRKGQTDTFGPPYFLGALIVGCAMVLAGLADICMYLTSSSDGSATLKKIPKYTAIEMFLTGVAIIGGFFGIFFVAIFGIPECDPKEFFSHCNYTDNLSANRNLAIAILISLLGSEIVAIVSIVVHCHVARQRRFNTRQNVYVTGGASNVAMMPAPESRPYHGGFGRNRNYDSFSADTQIIIDGNVIDKTPGGFSGAVLHPPQSSTVIHPPVGYPQYSGATSQNTQYIHDGHGHTSGESLNHLQEQNRLLREQIALQQQQLQLIQQQQQQPSASSSALPPPPPSYESCVQDPAQMKLLQQENEELENRYQGQQHEIKMSHSGLIHPKPSAPPSNE